MRGRDAETEEGERARAGKREQRREAGASEARGGGNRGLTGVLPASCTHGGTGERVLLWFLPPETRRGSQESQVRVSEEMVR